MLVLLDNKHGILNENLNFPSRLSKSNWMFMMVGCLDWSLISKETTR